MISEIYRKYFQKSFTFLYPLLGFKRGKHPRPSQTYISWSNTPIKANSRKLVCVYKKENTDAWRNFEMNYLITHKMLENSFQIDDDTVVYVFDMSPYSSDFDAFMQGKYSTFSSAAKKSLTDFYGTHTPEWVYIESFLFPAKYFKQYASILNVEEETLKEVGELCDRLDIKKETCSIPIGKELFV